MFVVIGILTTIALAGGNGAEGAPESELFRQ